jgi:hypothetical protein
MCHIFRRNCLLKHVFEGKIEGQIKRTRERGERLKQLQYYGKEREGIGVLTRK